MIYCIFYVYICLYICLAMLREYSQFCAQDHTWLCLGDHLVPGSNMGFLPAKHVLSLLSSLVLYSLDFIQFDHISNLFLSLKFTSHTFLYIYIFLICDSLRKSDDETFHKLSGHLNVIFKIVSIHVFVFSFFGHIP